MEAFSPSGTFSPAHHGKPHPQSASWKYVMEKNLVERATGIEPVSSGWKPEVIAIIRRPRKGQGQRSEKNTS